MDEKMQGHPPPVTALPAETHFTKRREVVKRRRSEVGEGEGLDLFSSPCYFMLILLLAAAKQLNKSRC